MAPRRLAMWAHRRVWSYLPEPRIISAIMLFAWLLLAAIGALALASPPVSIASAIGPTMSLTWACLLISGGIVGAVGCVTHFWWAERAGIFLVLAGASIYLSTILHLHFHEHGNRLIQAGFVLLAIVFMLTRLVRIWGLQADPRPRR